MRKIYYFAYGSNLNKKQMAVRCKSSVPLCRAYLPNYVLDFKDNGKGSGVATILPVDGAFVEGALYEVTKGCLKSLDRYEGTPLVYFRTYVNVFTYNHEEIQAVTYIIQSRYAQSLPNDEYLSRIERGYEDFKIPFKTLISAYENLLENGVINKEPGMDE